jgi:hypothetical protein
MPNDTRHRALTIEDARNLLAHVSAVIAERDRLREEVGHLRLIMGELDSLRELINDGPCAMVLAVSTTNGHVARQAADGFPLDSSRSNDLDDAAHMPPDNTAAPDDREERPPAATPADCREQEAGNLKFPLVSSKTNFPTDDFDQAEASAGDRDDRPAAKLHTGETLPPADDSELVAETPPDTAAPDDQREPPPTDDGQGEQATGETETAQRPPQGTLMERILTAIEQSDKPRRGWHLQKELGLPRVPTPELSRLVKRGFLTRHGESIYGVTGREYESTKSC